MQMLKCSVLELLYVILPITNIPVQKKRKYNKMYYSYINLLFIERENIPTYWCVPAIVKTLKFLFLRLYVYKFMNDFMIFLTCSCLKVYKQIYPPILSK